MVKSLPPAIILSTEVRDFPSTIMGINYQISIWFPEDYPKPGYKYPVIYLTDGEVLFGQVVSMILFLIAGGLVPECLIVGLGHHVSKLDEWVEAREIDYNPPEIPEGEPGQKRANDFLSFLNKELIPFIETTYAADPTDRCLAGYSSGGMFTLYTLLHEPDLFSRYLIASGTFDQTLPFFLTYEEQLAKKRKSLPVHAFFSAGELEENVVPGLHLLVNKLTSRNYEGLHLERFIDVGEGHFSTSPTAFCKGLKAIYKSD